LKGLGNGEVVAELADLFIKRLLGVWIIFWSPTYFLGCLLGGVVLFLLDWVPNNVT